MKLFITEDLINTLDCGKFALFNSDDITDIINAAKTEAKQQAIMPTCPGGYIDTDIFIGKILNGEYVYLQHIKYELSGAIDMFYNVFGLESDN